MIWPDTLTYFELFNVLHDQETASAQSHGGISKYHIFTYIFIDTFSTVSFHADVAFLIICFILDFISSYLFTAFSNFSWVCWIAPSNPVANQMFVVSHGLGMRLITFDWHQIAAFHSSSLVI